MLRRLLACALAVAPLAACKNPQPCPKPLVECNGQCVDTQSDPRFCGGCGVACRAGEVCAAGRCAADSQSACPDRVGGGFVTVGYPNGASGACAGQVVKLWVQSASFLDDAVSYVGSTALDRIPLLDVAGGSDCDGAWTWHADPFTPAFVSTVNPADCGACPAGIQANVPGYVAAIHRWCPSDARILAVERRAGP
jgi:hypothetical protein